MSVVLRAFNSKGEKKRVMAFLVCIVLYFIVFYCIVLYCIVLYVGRGRERTLPKAGKLIGKYFCCNLQLTLGQSDYWFKFRDNLDHEHEDENIRT